MRKFVKGCRKLGNAIRRPQLRHLGLRSGVMPIVEILTMIRWLSLAILSVLPVMATAEDDWYYDTSQRTVTTPSSMNTAQLDAESVFETRECTVGISIPAVTDIFDSVWFSLMPSPGIDCFSSEKLSFVLIVK